MLKNYLKQSFRSLSRKPAYSIINITGLSAGLICVLFIFNWVYDELTYDTHYENAEQIYRVVAEAGTGEDRWHQTVTSLPLGPTMDSTFPEVESMVRLDYNDAIIENGEDQFFEDDIVFTDPSFFDMFSYSLISGNQEEALNEPYKLVLTESSARKFFGDENPVGSTLKMYLYDPDGLGMDYEVTGVIPDPPAKSHFSFTMLGSMATLASVGPQSMQNWGNNSWYTYVALADNADPIALEAKLPGMVDEHMGEMIDEYDLYYRFYLQQVTSIHLNSDLQYEIQANGNRENVMIFSLIGFLILTLAVINYINLTTAFSLDRAKEIGVRKVMGALRGQVVRQHLVETLLLTFASIAVALLAVKVLEPMFVGLTGKSHLGFDLTLVIIQLLVLGVPIGLIAGYFPAILLSRIPSLLGMKGQTRINSKTSLRTVLVAFQFSVTMIILIGVIVVNRQMSFVNKSDLGYDTENLMILRVNGSEEVRQGYEPFKQALSQNPNIMGVARSGSRIARGLGNSNGRVNHANGDVQFEKLYRLSIGYDYIDTYGLKIIEGRNINRDIHSDSTEGFILNIRATQAYGWTPEEAIGKEMRFRGMDGRIIGVVNDFHFNTLHHEIEPAILFIRSGYSNISVKMADSGPTSQFVKETWKEHFPNSFLDFSYQDETLVDSYQSDQRFGNIFNIFSVLSILLAFLGLFGLVGFTVRKKTKEIGIRKVLGASTVQVLGNISLSFVKIILLSAVIAIPVAWYFMDSWLATFPYRIGLNPGYFVLAVGLLLFAAMTMIVIQSIKSSLANPAETLKEE